MPENSFTRAALAARYLSAAGMFALAAALVYFTCELASLARHVPDVVNSVDRTVDKIDPIINEVSIITSLVPPILEEVAATRKAVVPAIDEYAKTNAQLPRILEHGTAHRGAEAAK